MQHLSKSYIKLLCSQIDSTCCILLIIQEKNIYWHQELKFICDVKWRDVSPCLRRTVGPSCSQAFWTSFFRALFAFHIYALLFTFFIRLTFLSFLMFSCASVSENTMLEFHITCSRNGWYSFFSGSATTSAQSESCALGQKYK